MSRPWVTVVTSAICVLVAYFVAPVDTGRAPLGVLVGVLVSVAALAGVVMIIVAETRGARRLTGWHLVIVLEVALVVFAFTYYVIATNHVDQFAGLSTRLDALYFSTATAATVGYGDVHPIGQRARGVATLHMIFNLVFLAAVLNLARDRMSERRAGRHGATLSDPHQDA